VGFFALGLEPNGTTDPYALRRQTLGIIRIIRDKKLTISLPDLVSKSASILYEIISFDLKTVVGKVLNFIKDRFKNILLSEDITQDLIESVVAVDFNFLNQLEERIMALKRFRDLSKDFEILAIAFKRIMNIVKGFEDTSRVNPDLFEYKSEKNLWETFQLIKDKVKKEIDRENYFEALNLIAGLSGAVDEFFSEVMVMAEDKKVRENRIGMLKELNHLFLQIADFSKFAI